MGLSSSNLGQNTKHQNPGIGVDNGREDKKQSPPTSTSGAVEDKERIPNPSDDRTLEVEEEEGEGEGEGEEGECGFCLFMKGGGCKDTFIAWENCVEEAEKNKEDVVEKCFQVTDLLKKCMDSHSEYYEPILRAEKAMEEEAARELEREPPSDHNPEVAPPPAVANEGK